MNVTAFFIIFSAIFIVACKEKNKPANTIPADKDAIVADSFTYNIFKRSDSQYGYNVLKNKKIFIHQPIIPMRQGNKGFLLKEEAIAVAELIADRLRSKNYRVVITADDIDSLVPIKGKAIPINISIQRNKTGEGKIIIENSTTVSSAVLNSTKLSELYDKPLKKKWVRRGHLPFGYRAHSLSFSIANVVYLGGGEIKDEEMSDFWGYNTKGDWWMCLAELPNGERTGGIAFSVGNRGYIGLGNIHGGNLSHFKKDFYKYDPAINIWLKKQNFPGTPRVDAISFTIGNKGYIGLGYDGKYCRDFYEYDTSKDKWQKKADFAGGPVSASVGVGAGNSGFVFCGDRVPENQKFVYEYLPATDTWRRKKDFPGQPRYFLNAVRVDTNFIIVGNGGAEGGEERFRDFYLYNITKDSWEQIPDYPVNKLGNSRPGGGEVNGKVFLGGGYNVSAFLNDWNSFDYYFSVRKDTGVYDETTCYSLKYNDTWDLYQECSPDDCFAGVAVRSNRQLGRFCYGSYFTAVHRNIIVDASLQSQKLCVFPRNFFIATQEQPDKSVSLRLFFTREELVKQLNEVNAITKQNVLLSSIKVLQYTQQNIDTNPFNNSYTKSNCNFITPQWYSYGAQAETIVAEFGVNNLQSEFYLVLPF